MLRNLVTSLLEHEKIHTTDAKAKEARRVAEKMITLGKRGDLHAMRQALAVIKKREVVQKLFDTLAVRYRERSGGYSRVIKVGRRIGDGAPISIIELIPDESSKKKTTKKRAKKSQEPKKEDMKKEAVKG
jgi:large subunit ribosomal protein L17